MIDNSEAEAKAKQFPGLSYMEEEALTNELTAARRKFPGSRLLLTALMEEVGELAAAILKKEGSDRVRKEALQCACVAMRIYREGDPLYNDITEAEAKP